MPRIWEFVTPARPCSGRVADSGLLSSSRQRHQLPESGFRGRLEHSQPSSRMNLAPRRHFGEIFKGKRRRVAQPWSAVNMENDHIFHAVSPRRFPIFICRLPFSIWVFPAICCRGWWLLAGDFDFDLFALFLHRCLPPMHSARCLTKICPPSRMGCPTSHISHNNSFGVHRAADPRSHYASGPLTSFLVGRVQKRLLISGTCV